MKGASRFTILAKGFLSFLPLLLLVFFSPSYPSQSSVSRATASLPDGSQQSALQKLKQSFQRPDQIPFPRHNPFSEAKYQLGKRLFFDPRLSRSQTLSCASCHNPSLSWTDGLSRAKGHEQKELTRRSPTLLNAAWGKTFFWDGRAETLEAQALGPIQSPQEMNMPLPKLVKTINAITEYGPLFEAAFGTTPITAELIAKAIATFERTIVSDISPFDRWISGEESAISEKAKKGFSLFSGKATCIRCHSGWNFTNGQFADIGIPTQDRGRGSVTSNSAVDFAFKTPTLRNVARRAPYMHDGSLVSLPEVIENYHRGGIVSRPGTRLFLTPLSLSEEDKENLVAFLETLTSEDESVSIPLLPRGEMKEKP